VKTNKLYIYGKHASFEALMHVPRAVKRVFLAKGFNDNQILKRIDELKLEKSPLHMGEARADLTKGSAHQGVIVQLSIVDIICPFSELANLAATPSTLVVLLSGLSDPHNVGAIIRSAAAFGASAILLPEKNQAGVTSTVLKVSAGMAFQVPLIAIPSPEKAIELLKKKGFKTYALMAGKNSVYDAAFNAPSIFVFGNEGQGIDKSVRALCDEVLSIPMHTRAESLNVAASAAVALGAWSKRHPEALT
jgi:23S rRNA (guanosine2251-2'-O)-methyltransferase